MKNKMKKTALLFTLTACISSAAPLTRTALAAEKEPIVYEYAFDEDSQAELYQARFNLLHQLISSLSIDNRVAYIYAESDSYEKVTHDLTVNLQESKNGSTWKTIKTYTASKDSTTSCIIDKEYDVTMGYYYRLEITVVLDDGEQTEEFTKTTKVKECYDLLSE